jgi:SSS family solute:Na+ symporter
LADQEGGSVSIYAVVVALYFAVIVCISVLTRKLAGRSAVDFLIAGRNLGTLVCAVVVAAEWLGGLSTIGVSEKAFSSGTLQPVLYNIATAAGMVIIGFTVASHYRKKNVHTVSEMLDFLFGKQARHVSAFAFLIAYVTLSYVQLQACASIVSPLFNLSWTASVVLSAVLITVYVYIGGMHAIALVGIIHVVVMFFGIGLALAIGLAKVGGLGGLQASLVTAGGPQHPFNPFGAGLGYAMSLLLGGVLGGMAGQASIQPIFAARSPAVAKRAAVVSSVIIAPFGVLVGLLGLIARTGAFFDPAGVANPKMVLPTLFTTTAFIHPVLGGLALAGILAAILSTVGPVNFAVVTIATKDIYQGIFNLGTHDKEILRTARKLVVLVSAVTIPLAVTAEGGILDAAYISYAIRAIGAIVILLGIYARGWADELGVRLAFIGGTLAVFVCILAGNLGWFHIDKTYGAVIFAALFLIAGRIWRVARR